MAQYTNQEVVTLNGGTLAGPETVANINFTGEDAYARALTVSNTAVGTVNISSGGTMYMRGDNATAENINVYGPYTINKTAVETSGGRFIISGGTVNTLTLDNEGLAWVYGGEVKNALLSKTDQTLTSSVKLRIYGGVVSGGSNDDNKGAKEIYAWGGILSNFTMKASMYAFASQGAYFKGGTFNGARLAIRGGTVEGMTILNAKDEQHHRMSTGLMTDCTIAA